MKDISNYIFYYSQPWAYVQGKSWVYFVKGVKDPKEHVWVVGVRDGDREKIYVLPRKVTVGEIDRILASGEYLHIEITRVDAVLEEYSRFIPSIRQGIVDAIAEFKLEFSSPVIFMIFRTGDRWHLPIAWLLPVYVVSAGAQEVVRC